MGQIKDRSPGVKQYLMQASKWASHLRQRPLTDICRQSNTLDAGRAAQKDMKEEGITFACSIFPLWAGSPRVAAEAGADVGVGHTAPVQSSSAQLCHPEMKVGAYALRQSTAHSKTAPWLQSGHTHDA